MICVYGLMGFQKRLLPHWNHGEKLMYNSVTEDEISSAPELAGLDPERLSAKLAETYARLVSIRVTLAQGESGELQALLEELRRVATTYEALFLAGCLDGSQAERAGFVAATAYSFLYRGTVGPVREVLFSSSSISLLASAMLLFIAAGYYADAHEISKRHRPASYATDLDGYIGNILFDFAQGVAHRTVEPIKVEDFESDEELAVATLYSKCCVALVQAENALVFNDVKALGVSFEQLRRICELCFEEFDCSLGSASSIFSGPLQLGKLLIVALRKLASGSIHRIQIPDGVDVEQWKIFIGEFAKDRPVLWQQQCDAVSMGILDIGTSSVLSLPTGAGKTSLAELKVAAHICAGKKVVFIAPTHALESQISERMKNLFGDDVHRVTGDFSEDDQLGHVTVCTPEACLTLLSLAPDSFVDVGLFVFDECHILSALDLDHARRALDSMLCLLAAFEHQPSADFLLMSAMVKNADELSGWLADVTGRPAVAFKDEWKPTRQMRGCVVYQKSELQGLKERLRSTRRLRAARNPPAALKRELLVRPLSLFCLKNSWTNSQLDYSLLPLSDEKVLLDANTNWNLSANRNEVASAIGRRFSRVGAKTLIFCGEVSSTGSIVDKLTDVSENVIALNVDEQYLYEQILLEFGSEDELYFSPKRFVGVHHGLLFKEERDLIESVFKRSDSGLDVLAATPTLAQGLNLPAEVIIIAGDDRFDITAENPAIRQRLEAHEILNAAGRAGRAGHFAQGIVIIIPGQPIGYDEDAGEITGRWIELVENVFSKTDQCVDVEDPLSFIFDAVESGQVDSDSVQYVIQRLYPVADSNATLRKNIGRSLWLRSKAVAEREASIDRVVEKFRVLDIHPETNVPENLLRLSEKTGINVRWLQAVMMELVEHRPRIDELSVPAWLEWIYERPLFPALLKPETRTEIESNFELEAGADFVSRLYPVMASWMKGEMILRIEGLFPENNRRRSKCKRSRVAISRWIPDVAYVVGIISSLYKAVFDEEPPLALQVLPRCIRLGVDSPEKLAFLHLKNYSLMRVVAHQKYAAISEYVNSSNMTSFAEIRSAVHRAIIIEEVFGDD